jgi:hypothetical protein
MTPKPTEIKIVDYIRTLNASTCPMVKADQYSRGKVLINFVENDHLEPLTVDFHDGLTPEVKRQIREFYLRVFKGATAES